MPAPDPASVTQLLEAVRGGDRAALHDLFPLVYRELYAQAQRQRRRWQGDDTLNTTALVHEAYLKLVDQTEPSWQNRAHFLGVAARAMRHILIDYAKQRQRLKRGGGVADVPLDAFPAGLPDPGTLLAADARADDLLALDRALQRLATVSERQVQVVECRFFGGLSIEDTAAALVLSPATVKRDWTHARAWLYRELNEAPG